MTKFERIKQRAYEIYQYYKSIGEPDDPSRDWFAAEEDIMQDDLWLERQMKGLGYDK
jgi:hypothetical protein